MQGSIYQVDKIPILDIPVFDTPDEKVKLRIINLVDQVLELNEHLQKETLPKQKNQLLEKINKSEKLINQMFYKLYKLDQSEIDVIEGGQGDLGMGKAVHYLPS